MKLDHTDFDPARFKPLQQHRFFAAALAGMGCPMQTVSLPGGGIAQVMSRQLRPLRHPFRMVSRGPYWATLPDQTEQYDALCLLRDQGVRVINAEHRMTDSLRAAGYRQVFTPGSIATLTLGDGPNLRRTLMTAKWRNALRKAEMANLKIEIRPYQHGRDKWILDADQKQQKIKGYRGLPAALTQAFAVMNAGQAIIVTVAKHAVPIAAMIFLRHGNAATYHIGWSSAEGRSYNAHNLCLSRMTDWLEEDGTRAIDLGTIDTEASPGLARFKLGIGAQVKQLGGTWLHLRWFPRR